MLNEDSGVSEMKIDTLDALGKLSKEALLEAALDKANTSDIQDIALQKWMALNEREHLESMARMRALLRQFWDLLDKPGAERLTT
jgi:hypothetical protein